MTEISVAVGAVVVLPVAVVETLFGVNVAARHTEHTGKRHTEAHR